MPPELPAAGSNAGAAARSRVEFPERRVPGGTMHRWQPHDSLPGRLWRSRLGVRARTAGNTSPLTAPGDLPPVGRGGRTGGSHRLRRHAIWREGVRALRALPICSMWHSVPGSALFLRPRCAHQESDLGYRAPPALFSLHPSDARAYLCGHAHSPCAYTVPRPCDRACGTRRQRCAPRSTEEPRHDGIPFDIPLFTEGSDTGPGGSLGAYEYYTIVGEGRGAWLFLSECVWPGYRSATLHHLCFAPQPSHASTVDCACLRTATPTSL